MNKSKRPHGIFIAGTDTGVGKTVVSAALLRGLKSAGIDAVYMKPVQTGCKKRGQRTIAPDLDFVISAAGITPPETERRLMAPCRFRRPCSPHLAAALEKKQIRLSKILRAFAGLKRRHDFVVVEGAGGILTPLERRLSMLDLMKKLGLPVALVARPGLGTLNHTLLTLGELRRARLKIKGIILNHAVKSSRTYIVKDNRAMLEKLGRTRIISELPHFKRPGAPPVEPGLAIALLR
ncbi:MAG: dethiobiotin synthase [Kiritimatiellae bacterium]|nr:dethiobiotin synthase [Kiritimatiellia bacterium]